MGQTDEQMDAELLQKPCSAYKCTLAVEINALHNVVIMVS